MPRHHLALIALAAIAPGTTILAAADGPAADACPILATQPGDAGLSAVHDCSGLNVCKGLGGCKITDADLAELAQKRGVPHQQAGTAHSCAGLNACKGLGGCKVSAEKFVKLFEKRRAAELQVKP